MFPAKNWISFTFKEGDFRMDIRGYRAAFATASNSYSVNWG